MMIFSDPYMSQLLLRAILVGGLVSLCASLLGVTLVTKRFSMIGDGLSHVGFGALAIATALDLGEFSMAVSLPIVLATAFLMMRLTEKKKLTGDSVIAVFSTGAVALGTLLFKFSDNQYADICNSLFGSSSMSTLSDTDLYITIVMSVVVLVLFIFFFTKIFAATFDEPFARASGIRVNLYNMLIAALTAVTVVIGMKMVGAIMVSGLIVFPALSSMRVCKRFWTVVVVSGILAIFGFGTGFTMAIGFDLQPGPAIIAVHLLIFVIFLCIGKAISAAGQKRSRRIELE